MNVVMIGVRPLGRSQGRSTPEYCGIQRYLFACAYMRNVSASCNTPLHARLPSLPVRDDQTQWAP
jgi:hypothetical protein